MRNDAKNLSAEFQGKMTQLRWQVADLSKLLKQSGGSGAQAAIKNPYKRIAQLLIKTFNLRFETLCTKVRQEAPFEPAKPDRDGMPTFDEKRELYRA